MDPGWLRADPAVLLARLPAFALAALALTFVSWLAQIGALGAVSLALGADSSEPRGTNALRVWTSLGPCATRLLALACALFAMLCVLPLLVASLGLGLGALAGAVASLVHPLLGILVMACAGLLGLGAAAACAAYLGARYAVSVPELVRGDRGVREALAESAALTSGRRLHVILICFLALLATSIATFLIQAPVAAARMLLGGTSPALAALGAAAAGLAVLLAGPFPLIAIVLLHTDLLSVRRDAAVGRV